MHSNAGLGVGGDYAHVISEYPGQAVGPSQDKTI